MSLTTSGNEWLSDDASVDKQQKEETMPTTTYDIITVGGRLAGAALASPRLMAGIQRLKALPLMAQDNFGVSDHSFSGPDLHVNETVRRRFFGEE